MNVAFPWAWSAASLAGLDDVIDSNIVTTWGGISDSPDSSAYDTNEGGRTAYLTSMLAVDILSAGGNKITSMPNQRKDLDC